ncbi:1,4-alpha-glucan (glycogen) branching enzyme, GH-13-type [Pseudonocardia sp. N23]|nr:1,4-alpha-glucan (glycogen) branching enzyme, GH-13-type [Pseudonocardia sp. N23]
MDREDTNTRTIGSETTGPHAPDPRTVDRLLGGAHHNPHGVLGLHPGRDGTVVRTLRPHADAVSVLLGGDADRAHPLTKVHDAGLFSGIVPGTPDDYRLSVTYGEDTHIVDEPYRWLPTLGEVDLHLIAEGRHERLWDVLGSHVRSYDTPSGAVTGTSFAVWAPTAQGVRVTGDFDGWAGWAHPMRSLGSSGVWELFVPDVGVGTRYKYRILGQDGRWRDKADPMAFATEIPPATASVVTEPGHEWADGEWMTARTDRRAHAEPMSVYEIHLGSWRPGLSYREMAHELVDYLNETGFTHVELLPVAEHPFGGSWGYQVTSYYAPTSRFGSPDDFRHFVDTLHQAGYGVIVDWVPAHFPRDEWALAKFDGGPLYEHADPRRGEQPDWGTLVFDFGRREVRNFLVANALFWCEEFHIDGLRVDAVASMLYLDYSRADGQWLPNIHGGRENLDAVAFLQEMNATVYRNHPGVVTIAEESTAWPGVTRPTHLGGLGFGFKWNMGWMHDTLDYTGRDPIHRSYHHNQMTFALMYAFSENYVLPISHDEVVHGKGSLWTRMPGDDWNKAAGVRALLAFMWAHPGKQLLFMGSEFGQVREWSEQRPLDWELLEDPLHSGVRSLVGDLNRAYRDQPALWALDTSPAGFSWIDANDASGNVLSFLRHSGRDSDDGTPTVLACIANFAGAPNENYRVGLPFAGRWRELVNTDAEAYGGSGVGNLGVVEAEQTRWHGRPASAVLRLPPSGVLWLVPDNTGGPVHRSAVAAAAVSDAPAPTRVTEPPVVPVPEGAGISPVPGPPAAPVPDADPGAVSEARDIEPPAQPDAAVRSGSSAGASAAVPAPRSDAAGTDDATSSDTQ